MSKYYKAMRRMALYTDIGHGAGESVVWQYEHGTGLKTITEAEIFAELDAEIEQAGRLPERYEAGHNVWPLTRHTVARGRIDPDSSQGSIVFEDVPKAWQEAAISALMDETSGAVRFTVFDSGSLTGQGVSLQNYFEENF